MYQEKKGGWTFGAVIPPRALVFKIVRDYFETSSVQVWNAGISVKVFRQISLVIHYLYLFRKLMIRLDYQPLFGENEPALIPPEGGRIKDRTRETAEIELS